MNWIKLTPEQASAIAALSATNPTNNFVVPVADAQGDTWLAADVLTETNGLFSHYRELLTELTPTDEIPCFPPSSDS